MAEDNPGNGAPPADSNGEGNTPAAPPGAFGIEVWGDDRWTYDSNNNRRAESAMIVRENGTTSVLWNRL